MSRGGSVEYEKTQTGGSKVKRSRSVKVTLKRGKAIHDWVVQKGKDVIVHGTQWT